MAILKDTTINGTLHANKILENGLELALKSDLNTKANLNGGNTFNGNQTIVKGTLNGTYITNSESEYKIGKFESFSGFGNHPPIGPIISQILKTSDTSDSNNVYTKSYKISLGDTLCELLLRGKLKRPKYSMYSESGTQYEGTPVELALKSDIDVNKSYVDAELNKKQNNFASWTIAEDASKNLVFTHN